MGCGDGTLASFLDDGTKTIIGIDIDSDCIEKAVSANHGSDVHFYCCGFDDYAPSMLFDAIVFVASLHHMNMAASLQKAKSHLSTSGKLLVIGLATPSSMADWVLEATRVIPSKAVSSLHHMQTSEELQIKTDYAYPHMKDVRSTIKQHLPGAKIHYALHYRYLLEWSAR